MTGRAAEATSGTAPPPAPGTLRTATLWKVFFRSLFIQAGFNPEAMQTLGLLFSIEPALEELYTEPESRKRAVTRHLTPFNTHPYLAAALVGGILNHETKIARGEEDEAVVANFKRTLMGPLAAVGDSFFWFSLRPAAGAISAFLVPFAGPWAAVIFLVLYNVVHISLRASLFVMGWRYGNGVVTKLSRVNLPAWAMRLRGWAAAAAGAVGATMALQAGAVAQSHSLLYVGGAVVLGILTLLAVERRLNPYAALYIVAAVGLLASNIL